MVKLLSLILFLFSFNIFARPTGDKAALVIIDMQPFFVERGQNDKTESNQKKLKKLIEIQIEAINFAKKIKIPIIFIEYKGLGRTNEKLRNAVKDYADVKIFLKNTDGMFSRDNQQRSNLIEYLESKEIGNLIITGANGGACVEQSIRGSFEENYNVIALNTAIADFNFKEFIYPYNDRYYFIPGCENCNFKDLDDINLVSVNLSTSRFNRPNVNINVNDDSRDNRKIETGGSDKEESNTPSTETLIK